MKKQNKKQTIKTKQKTSDDYSEELMTRVGDLIESYDDRISTIQQVGVLSALSHYLLAEALEESRYG
jgi:hypothetical protein